MGFIGEVQQAVKPSCISRFHSHPTRPKLRNKNILIIFQVGDRVYHCQWASVRWRRMNWHCTLIQISSLGDWWWHTTDALSQWTGSVLSISLESIFSSRVTQDEEFMKTDALLYKRSHGEMELSWFVYVLSHSTKTPNVPWLHEHHIVSKWSAELLGSSLGQLLMRSLSSQLCSVPS